jgi:uncharacterized protein GlcG (DUF336 family)
MLLDQANLIADSALQKGRELKFAPLTVVVLDAGGQIKVLKREDNASLLRLEIAMGKAWGCSAWVSVAVSWHDGRNRCRCFSLH